MVKLKNIHKTYHNGSPLHVLKGIDMTIEEGEFVSIMGSSGSGKSTLLNIIGLLDGYDTGEYLLNNSYKSEIDCKQKPSIRRIENGF